MAVRGGSSWKALGDGRTSPLEDRSWRETGNQINKVTHLRTKSAERKKSPWGDFCSKARTADLHDVTDPDPDPDLGMSALCCHCNAQAEQERPVCRKGGGGWKKVGVSRAQLANFPGWGLEPSDWSLGFILKEMKRQSEI